MRILDFTMFQAGPMATLFAADFGADVVKVEAIQRLDGWRGVGRGPSRAWDNSGLFNWVNRGKRGITLNLTDPRGAALARRLAAGADVVVENYTPRVMDGFRLGYADLVATNDDLIMLSMPGFGRTTTWRDYAAFAWTTEQMSAICHLTGYEDGPPLFTGTSFGDPLAGLMGGLALLAAVRHRQLTGEGQHIDLSQIEAATSFVGEVLVERQLTGHERARRGNDDPARAPHGVHQCGDGRWIAISCADDDEWRRLSAQVALPVCADAPLAERRARGAEIGAALHGWAATADAGVLAEQLQRAGVTAAVVHDGRSVFDDPQLRARGFFVAEDRGDIGVTHQTAQPWRFARTDLPPYGTAPRLGEHNREVLGDELGLGEAELADLERDGVIGDTPLGG
ncbi:MAG: CoA transferase [Ilumatobacteraceae bacterium]